MSSEMVGLSEFRESIHEKHSQYSIFAAQASIEKVIGSLVKLFKVEDWKKNVSTRTLADLQGLPIIQLKGSPWTLAYWTVDRYLNIKRDCCQLSQKIDAKVIQIWEFRSHSCT